MTADPKSETTQIAGTASVQEEEQPKTAAEAMGTAVAAGNVEADDAEKMKAEVPKSTEVEKEQQQPNSDDKEKGAEKAKEDDGKVEKEAPAEDLSSGAVIVEKSASFREESNFLSDLKEHERKALFELRAKVEEAILQNKLFKEEEPKETGEKDKVKLQKPETPANAKEAGEEGKEKEEEKEKEKEKEEEEEERSEEAPEKPEEAANAESGIDGKPAAEPVDKEISLWGVPLLPSIGGDRTDVILLKFLRAREFKVKEAFEMLNNTLRWRKETRIDSILEEDSLGTGLEAAAYMDSGTDREGHPICYNVYGVFQDQELYSKTFGDGEKTEQFLRWRFQLMEKGIQKLDFKPGGIASILQVTDLKSAPGVSKKELRVAMKRAVGLLQDNYPEFVARNIFINVPFWYYAFNALLSPFLTQRTKSKFVFARPSKVSETLLRYIPSEDIPLCYGGLRRENDIEFSVTDGGVTERIVKAGATENIELPAPEVGTTQVWDLTVLGWEVNYKEEFVPDDEGSYTIIVRKGKKMGAQEEAVRNSFRNNEPGKVVLTVENNTYKKKKVLYRYKIKNC